MRIPLKEPISPRYIYVNPATNKVHLMVPVISGQEISTDNTCKATFALKEFFDGGVLRELNTYKEALIFDIRLLVVDSPERMAKEERFSQINVYIDAVSAMKDSYGEAMSAFLKKPSNLYSIQLRPLEQDFASKAVNPVFSVNRQNDDNGMPLSALYNVMHERFSSLTIKTDPRTALITEVLSLLPATPTYTEIQQVLGEQCLKLFALTLDFSKRTDGTPATKETIDSLMGFDTDATPEDYIDALLGACVSDVWETLPTPPFYSIPITSEVAKKTERLSILSQFFLAHLNVYCKAKGISILNFGVILDSSPSLSNELIDRILTSLTNDEDVESDLCTFFNANAAHFGLIRSLNGDDVHAIRQKFESTWRTVTATKENPHMDDFMILDLEASDETAQFVTHQGAICANFVNIVDPIIASSNPEYFAAICNDFIIHPAQIPHQNTFVESIVHMDIDTLIKQLSHDQFEQLPETIKEESRGYPVFLSWQFLHQVAKGKQDEAYTLLMQNPAMAQMLLSTSGVFTDYSGRTFNCTPYEYAYWAKDTHMCRMLEAHMDEETKAQILARININDATGLVFEKNGQEHRSAHFDLTELKTALGDYIDGYSEWLTTKNFSAMHDAWIKVGKAQRDVPAHVAQEYCRPDRSFGSHFSFDEPTLPRVLTFYNWKTKSLDSWFPCTPSPKVLDMNFGLIRCKANFAETWGDSDLTSDTKKMLNIDLQAINFLDEARTNDLILSREHLNPPLISYSLSP